MTAEVTKLPASILDDDEAIDLGGRLSGTLASFDAIPPWFSLVKAELDEQITSMGKVRARDRASELTAQIRAKDSERDTLLERIDRKCAYLAGEPDPAAKAAAEHVLAAMDRRGLPHSKMGNLEQTVQLNALLEDLVGAPLAADVTLLQLDDLVNELKQTQQAFEDLIGRRAAERGSADEGTLPSLREVRHNLKAALTVVRDDLALAVRREPANYGDVAGTASGHIEVVTKARARRTRAAGDNDTGDVSA